MRIASTWSTTPARRAVWQAPESRATFSSMPVPTNGASARSSGTAWRCMFEPISARFASSFSRNGISEAATDTSCFGRDVDQVDVGRRVQHEVARLAGRDEVVGEPALGVELRVRLGDGVAHLLGRRHVLHVVGDLAVLDPAVGRLDEAVLVHPREAGERVDQADVRAFRGLDRAHPAVVGRMDVADLEAGALAGQTARPERRQAALVGDFRQRVGLVHELAELRRAEELAHRRRRGLRVDEILRHDRVDLDRGHAFADRALHAEQPDAVLVLHQLADRAHPAVAEVVDVVDLAAAVAQVDQRLHHRDDVLAAQRAHGVGRVEVEAHVHLDPADGREVVALAVEEQAVEHHARGFDRRRLAGAHDAVDVHQRLIAVVVLVDRHRGADVGADVDVVDVERRDLGDAVVEQHLERAAGDVAGLGVDVPGQLVAGLDPDRAGLLVDDVLGREAPDDGLERRQHLGDVAAVDAIP